MSDLGGGTAGIGRAANGGARGTSGTVPVPQAPNSSMRTPRDVMNRRQAREAAREAERVQAEAAEAEEQSRTQDERRRSAERRAGAVGVAIQPRDSGYRSTAVSAGGRTPAEPAYASTLPGTGTMPGERTSGDFAGRAGPSQPAEYPTTGIGTTGATVRPRGTSVSQDQTRPSLQQTSTAGTSRLLEPQSQAMPAQSTVPTARATRGPSVPPVIGPSYTEGQQPKQSNVSSFPHAFERWEDLSSRWEGLTSYWIRHLEQNTEEIGRDPVARQMSRQITDLSAAGANLFHAVVELQRLRASSERKFQRWFFETRAEQERAQEAHAKLENTIHAERQVRSEATGFNTRAEEDIKNADRMVAQMRRELQISKDEARRAWEELGRREQEERDRMLALRDGQPIWFGGVQVVPMQSAMSRGNSVQRPPTGEGIRQGQFIPGSAPQQMEEYDSYYPQEPSPTDTDPFTEGARSGQSNVRSLASGSTFVPYPPGTNPATPGSTAKPTIPTTSQQSPSQPLQPTGNTASTAVLGLSAQAVAAAPFYRHQDTFLHGPPARSSSLHAPETERSYASVPLSEEGSEDDGYELDYQGNIRLDAQGRPIPLGRRPALPEVIDDHVEGMEQPQREHEQVETYASATQHTRGEPSVSASEAISATDAIGYPRGYGPTDYEGDEYGEEEGSAGGGTGWESLQAQQHHHPTRLSDVLEEDERSRTSPSRASLGSRGRY